MRNCSKESAVKEQVTADDVNLNLFKPKNFESAALSKSSAKLTWDETDPERIYSLRVPDEEEDQREKTVSLLKKSSTEETSATAETSVEVTWDATPIDDDLGEMKKKRNENEATAWEKYLEKRKAKRKVHCCF
ncbi:unnamed protein product [Gongylonema pulchrum]|uniref:Protein phosphatase inhibitor n=1 Tax=Gongylonema pulchrum TaxID=637853 RepID=A0A183EVN4_9BILA|nr:unnamed protein product [Gongylonema pulchrum]